MQRRRIYPAVKTLEFSESEKQLESGRRPEPQARAEKLLRWRNYLRKEIEGLRGNIGKRCKGFDGGGGGR